LFKVKEKTITTILDLGLIIILIRKGEMLIKHFIKMKNYKLFLFVLVISSLYYCSEDTVGFEGKGTIKGIVVAKDTGDPLSDVKITTSPASSTVFTDSIGGFTLTDVIQNTYAVEAELDGYIISYESVTVTENTVSNVAFELVESNVNNSPPLAPELVFPEDGATDLALEVAFIWDSSDADGDEITYTLDLRNGTTNEMLFFEVGTDTTFVVSNLQLATHYFWQVTAADKFNDPVGSAISEFTTLTSPDNPFLLVKKIGDNNVIYSGNKDIDTIPDPNVNLLRLTSENANSFRPRRNNTVQKVAFLRTVGPDTQIFTMRLDGTDVSQVTTNIPVAGFRLDALDFAWARSGSKLYYPSFDKLYSIDPDGGGATLIYETPDGSFISEVAVPSFDDDLVLIKTNNQDGYEVRIYTIRLSTGDEETVILEGESGAAGGIDISANADKVLYTKDKSGSQNPDYQIFESRIFLYNIITQERIEVETDVILGENDLDVNFSPSEGGAICTRVLSNLNAVPSIYEIIFEGTSNDDVERFTDAYMIDWE
jgi:hypothetical protein